MLLEAIPLTKTNDCKYTAKLHLFIAYKESIKALAYSKYTIVQF